MWVRIYFTTLLFALLFTISPLYANGIDSDCVKTFSPAIKDGLARSLVQKYCLQGDKGWKRLEGLTGISAPRIKNGKTGKPRSRSADIRGRKGLGPLKHASEIAKSKWKSSACLVGMSNLFIDKVDIHPHTKSRRRSRQNNYTYTFYSGDSPKMSFKVSFDGSAPTGHAEKPFSGGRCLLVADINTDIKEALRIAYQHGFPPPNNSDYYKQIVGLDSSRDGTSYWKVSSRTENRKIYINANSGKPIPGSNKKILLRFNDSAPRFGRPTRYDGLKNKFPALMGN